MSSGGSGAGQDERSESTLATALVDALKQAGVRRMFGIPGGESSLDLIEAARRAGIEFVLTRHETAAIFMAATTADLDGTVGVAITTKGPGVANAANGIAHAALDRCPVLLITDGFSSQQGFATHQRFDQRGLLAPLVKAHSRLDGPDVQAQVVRLIETARASPRGPVHVELTGAAAQTLISVAPGGADSPNGGTEDRAGAAAGLAEGRSPAGNDVRGVSAPADDATLVRARATLSVARRPVVIVGLEGRDAAVATAVRRLVFELDCPALVTYKAKGVVADGSPHYAGLFTGGALERDVVTRADLIVLVGLDPVELIPQPWAYSAPVLEIAQFERPVPYVAPTLGVYGDLAQSLAGLLRPDPLVEAERALGADPAASGSDTRGEAGGERTGGGPSADDWSRTEIGGLREAMCSALRSPGARQGLTPQEVVELAVTASHACRRRPRVTVDAGAHMFSATAFWPCREPNDLLISNGLASMGFALPAAIASALHDRRRPALAFTGDGGLLMCLGELATAVETGARVVVIVFNDGSLSLIDIKQQQRALPSHGVRWTRRDFAGAMRALGGASYRATSVAGYRRALGKALTSRGPALIDVTVDPTGYPVQLRALRG